MSRNIEAQRPGQTSLFSNPIIISASALTVTLTSDAGASPTLGSGGGRLGSAASSQCTSVGCLAGRCVDADDGSPELGEVGSCAA